MQDASYPPRSAARPARLRESRQYFDLLTFLEQIGAA
jgi:hypothetical protein